MFIQPGGGRIEFIHPPPKQVVFRKKDGGEIVFGKFNPYHDRLGRFTSAAGAGAVIPDKRGGRAMTYAQAKERERQGKSAGNEQDVKPGFPVQIGTVDFSDKKAVLQQLKIGERAAGTLDYEVNYSVTADGKVWRVSGQGATVDPRAIPSSLKGSYSYHNHPAKDTWYSFSAEDAAFFIDTQEAYSKASDHRYQYVMKRTKETAALSYDEVYNKFNQIFSEETREKAWNGEIDMDFDGFHETMKVLSRELGFEYERKKKEEIE